MPSHLWMQGGPVIETEEDPQDVAERVDSALAAGTLIKIDTIKQGPLWMNPLLLVRITPRKNWRGRTLSS